MTKKSHGGDRRPRLVRMLEDAPEELQATEQRMHAGWQPTVDLNGLESVARDMQAAFRALMRERAAARVRARRAGTQREER